MTTFIYLDNYRGFTDALIPLRQVNWLVGENSTGKTSLLEVIDELRYPPFWFFEPKLGRGSNPRHYLDMVSAAAKSKSAFTIGAIAVHKSDKPDYGMMVTYGNLDGKAVPKRVSIIEKGRIRTVEGTLWARRGGGPYRSRVRICEPRSGQTQLDVARAHVSVHRASAGFKSLIVADERDGTPLFERFAEVLFDEAHIAERDVQVPYPFGTDFVDLAPIRTTPRRTYDAPQTGFSREGAHTPYIIRKRLANKSQADSFRQFLEVVGRDSGLFQSISIKRYGSGPRDPFEVQVVLGATALGLENVGYGVSQALPVLVEMFVRPRRATFTIQQPEVHLHPKAQASFGDAVADLARADGKRFIIETHSDFAIDRFRLNVRKNGPIPAQLLYFERTDKGSVATAIPISDSGDLSEDQPSGYREFFFNESLALLG